MKLPNNVVTQITQFLDKSLVLTDIEDRYAYSFEKIYEKKSYRIPDIVVRVDQFTNTSKLFNLAKDQDITVISRSTFDSRPIIEPSKITILLDDLKRPDMERRIEKPDDLKKTLIKKMQSNAYSVYHNIASVQQFMNLKESLNKCLQRDVCGGYCTITPSYQGIETWSAKGRMLLIKGLMKGELEYSKKIVDIMYTCSQCGNCFGECFEQLDFHKAITRIRQIIAEKKLTPKVFHTTASNIITSGDPAAIPAEKRLSWIENILGNSFPEKADYVYWVGCMVSYRTPKTAIAFYNILKNSRVSFTMLGRNEGCCGYVLLSSGLLDEARKVAKKTVEKIEKTKAKSLITPCAGCYYTFTKLFPEIVDIELPCEVLHSTQFIEREIKANKLVLNSLQAKVTYHDPCSLGRHCNVYETPRYILDAVPNLTITEMPFNQYQARCCGGGGGLWNYNHQISMDAALKRLSDDFIPLDINILTTACPLCQMNLRITARRNSIPVQVRDVTEIIESVMNENPYLNSR